MTHPQVITIVIGAISQINPNNGGYHHGYSKLFPFINRLKLDLLPGLATTWPVAVQTRLRGVLDHDRWQMTSEFFIQQKREIYVEFQRVCFSQKKLDRELNYIYIS
jgi:hypothetical protein